MQFQLIYVFGGLIALIIGVRLIRILLRNYFDNKKTLITYESLYEQIINRSIICIVVNSIKSSVDITHSEKNSILIKGDVELCDNNQCLPKNAYVDLTIFNLESKQFGDMRYLKGGVFLDSLNFHIKIYSQKMFEQISKVHLENFDKVQLNVEYEPLIVSEQNEIISDEKNFVVKNVVIDSYIAKN